MRRTIRWSLCVGAFLILASPAWAGGKPRIAVLDFVDKAGVEEGTGALAADLVRTELYRLDAVELAEREQLDKVMAEQRLQLSGLCDTPSCSVEIGKLLGVQSVWSGNIGKFGSRYLLTIQVIDVETAKVERMIRIQAQSLDDLADQTTAGARNLVAGDPDKAAGALDKGITLYEQGQYADAEAAFASATELDPRNVMAWQWRTKALLRLGRTAEAENTRTRALEAAALTDSPGDGPAFLALAFADIRVTTVDPWWQPTVAQRDYAKENDLPPAFENGQEQLLVLIPAGSFTMGSPPDERGRDSDEDPVHPVELTRGFYMGASEVTNAQYRRYQPSHSSEFTVAALPSRLLNPDAEGMTLDGDSQPVVHVSWQDATEYCDWLTTQERNAGRLPAGWVYRLPTEAEWEYACRAGTQTAYSFGKGERAAGQYAWYKAGIRRLGNLQLMSHPVGQKLPNPWGLYDMHGNVWEWCADWYGDDYYAQSPGRDPVGPESGTRRALRGGSWFSDLHDCRSASRGDVNSEHFWRVNGFRIVLSPAP